MEQSNHRTSAKLQVDSNQVSFYKSIYPVFIMLAGLILACEAPKTNDQEYPEKTKMETKMPYPTAGEIVRLDDAINALLPLGASIEIIADSFVWSEGPVWVESEQMVLFSDIPPNKIYKWTEGGGLEEYLHPSGYTGEGEYSYEPGSNGLIIGSNGELLMCQHGDRRIAQMDAPLDAPQAKFSTITDRWDGKRFNSPNDLIQLRNGDIIFTDPPYGLPKQAEDPSREIPFQGVYHYSASTQKTTLLTDEMSRPNGLAVSPDESKLYVANSDPKQAIWMVFDWDGTQLSNGGVFYDATSLVGSQKGLPDGLKVDQNGHVWATGPGGVWVFNKDGQALAQIKTGQATSNCAFDTDQSTFYMTADMYLMRIRLK